MFGLNEIKEMNAKYARQQTEAAAKRIKENGIDPLVRRVERAIADATSQGQSQLTVNPLAGLRTIIAPEKAKAVWAEIRRRGFKVSIRAGAFKISW